MTQGPSVLPCPSPIPKPTSQVLDPRQTLADVKNPPDSCRCLWWVQFFTWWRTRCWRQSLRTLSGPLPTRHHGSQSTRGPELSTPTLRSKPLSSSSFYCCYQLVSCLFLSSWSICCCCCWVAQSSRVWLFFNLKPSSPPGASVRGIFPGKNTGAGCHFAPPGYLPDSGSNSRPLRPHLPNWQVGSLPLSYQGSPSWNIV